MRHLTLAYRDKDRLPVILCIKAMAARYHDIDVEIRQIKGTEAYEAALFDGSCDVIIEHLEYLYAEAARGRKTTMFAAPSKGGDLRLVVPSRIQNPGELKGETMAVRSSGQPHAVTLWLRSMGLEEAVRTRIVTDDEVGRWGQWKKILSGECIGAFISPLYLASALAEGLKVLRVPEIPIVGHFAQACRSEFVREKEDLLRGYVKAVIHALCLMTARKSEALELIAEDPEMRVSDRTELSQRFDSIVSGLKARPYPSLRALSNTFEIATTEYPEARAVEPLSLWDLHWVKELDDKGFIDGLLRELQQ